MMIHPVAAAAPAIVQIDQKKVPVFLGELGKDSLTVREWIRRVEAMKGSFGWSELEAFNNAHAALFGAAATIMQSLEKRSVSPDYEQTWTWFKKQMLMQFGGMRTSRAIVDILQALKPNTDVTKDAVHVAAIIEGEFTRIGELIDKPDVGQPVAGHFTPAEAQTLCEKAAARVLEQFTTAFMINYQAPPIRSKMLEREPATMAECFKVAGEAYRIVNDERRPLGQAGTRVHQLDELPDEELEQALMAIQKRRGTYNPGNNAGKKNYNSGKKSNQSGGSGKGKLKCLHCQKNGHGIVDCFQRIRNQEPCYNQKGEPYFPASDKEWAAKLKDKQNSSVASISSVNPVTSEEQPAASVEPPKTQPEHVVIQVNDEPDCVNQVSQGQVEGKGSDFRKWV